MVSIEGGSKVCEETAQMIREEVRKFPTHKASGKLAEKVISLREWARDDSLWHKDVDEHFRHGGGPGARPRSRG